MKTILSRLGRLEQRAATACRQDELRLRINFVASDGAGSRGATVGVLLFGNGWSDTERAAALEENRVLRLQCQPGKE